MFIDTHCHIHESDFPLNISETLQHAHDNHVDQLICVGTNIESSRQAVAFAQQYTEVYASIGVHPHDTKDGYTELASIIGTGDVIAIGEIGLDYYYNHSSRRIQIDALEWQINLALKNNLPIIFHVRDAFDDFWPVFDNFSGITGELHSFTDTAEHLEQGLRRGLYIGVNGISTFTKSDAQKAVFASIPLDRLLLETDAPFLAPVPFRGTVNEPAHIKSIAHFHAEQRGISVGEIARRTSANATQLFSL